MKKTLAIALALMLCLGLLAACGSPTVVIYDGASTPAADPIASEEPSASEKPLEIPQGEIAMGFYMTAAHASGHSGSSDASDEAEGLAQTNVDIYAVTLNSEGVIVDCKIDAIQCKTNFDAAGHITTDAAEPILSKMELQDDYAMRSASGIGREWFEQVEALEQYCIGKTADEVAGIALDDAGKATDADLIAGITMPLGDFIDGVVNACKNAKCYGAQEGDTLYLHSSAEHSSSSADATAEADGLAQCDVTAGAYTLDGSGVITGLDLDCVQCKIGFDASGHITTDLSGEILTKTELEYDYHMQGASPIGKEWFEQTAFFEEYCLGKTVGEIAGIAVNPDNGHVAESEVDLVAGTTMNIGAFVDVLTKSGAVSEPLEIPAGELAMGFYMKPALAFGHSGSSNASAEAEGLAQANVDIYAVTLNSEGVIVDCKIDAIQCKTNFDAAGHITTDAAEPILSKMELQDDYAMRSASGIGREWFEQVEALEQYCIGKTADEVAGIALDDAGKATDADLIAGITMPLGDFIDGVVNACKNAKCYGAQEGDTLYLHSSAEHSSSSADATAEADGLAQCDVTAGAYTLDGSGVITGLDLDCVQCKIGFDASGHITTDLSGEILTKTELEYDYHMQGASPIGKEWFEQTAFFEEYCLGKTVGEIAGIAVNPDNGHVAESEVDLVAGTTMNIGAFVDVLTKSGAN